MLSWVTGKQLWINQVLQKLYCFQISQAELMDESNLSKDNDFPMAQELELESEQ